MQSKLPFLVSTLCQAECKSFDAFETDIKGTRQPNLLKGLLRDWPALASWSFDYLANKLNDEDLDVYISRDRFFPGEYTSAPDGIGKSADGRKTARMKGKKFFKLVNSSSKTYYYLHAFPIPATLSGDINLSAAASGEIGRFLWVSAQGHTTPTHFDGSDNVLTQLIGHKRFILFAPDQFENLYVYGSDHRYAGHSQVFDLEAVDLTRFPRIAHLKGYTADLAPGDVLYIPKFWWHSAYTLSPSASVNMWWNDMLFPDYPELKSMWIALRLRLFEGLPPELPQKYMAYFSRILLFSDIAD